MMKASELKPPRLSLHTIASLPTAAVPELFGSGPGGLPAASVAARLQQNGRITAYQLWGQPSASDPLYTLRRILVSGNWTAQQLYQQLHKN